MLCRQMNGAERPFESPFIDAVENLILAKLKRPRLTAEKNRRLIMTQDARRDEPLGHGHGIPLVRRVYKQAKLSSKQLTTFGR